jgi:hypothetical protein
LIAGCGAIQPHGAPVSRYYRLQAGWFGLNAYPVASPFVFISRGSRRAWFPSDAKADKTLI